MAQGLRAATPRPVRPANAKPRRASDLARMGTVHALLMAGALGLVASAQAQTPMPPRGADTAPDTLRPLIGAWDLELVGASRRCTVTFGTEATAHGRQLRFPATCRRALPILSEVSDWSLTPNGRPRLNDATGKPVISFEQTGADKRLQGKGSDGKQYSLDPKGYPRTARRVPQTPSEAAALSAQRPTRVDPASAPALETVSGRYMLMRQQNREACRITLASGPAAPGGNAPASFDGICRDTGLTIFDPAGWRYAAGRLTLVARKGHGVELIFEDGQWRKDPAIGAPLMMRKLAQ